MQKTCTKCGAEKVLDEFYRQPHGKHGRASICKECRLATNKQRHEERAAQDPNYWRARSIRLRYGLTLDEYEARLEAQDHKCAVCSRPLNKQARPHLDHCHSTGAIRGFLCQWCNSALGLMDDSPDRILALAKYVERHAG